MNTDDERAIVDAAKPGPWEHPSWGGTPSVGYFAGRLCEMAKGSHADAAMIARARTVLPLALDVVAAAEAWHKASGPGGASWENTAREYAARQALLAALGAWKAAQ